MKEKEFLYVGYYYDVDGNKILKIGTTKDIKERGYEHNHNYRKAKRYTMPREEKFHFIWSHPLSKYNTIRYEDKNRQMWIDNEIGQFVRNDRFVIAESLAEVEIKIRKTYKIALVQGGFCLLEPPIDERQWEEFAFINPFGKNFF